MILRWFWIIWEKNAKYNVEKFFIKETWSELLLEIVIIFMVDVIGTKLFKANEKQTEKLHRQICMF